MNDRPALTHRRVLKIALPIVLANVTVPILGVVDTGVVGQLHEAAPIGAVGIGAVILAAIYWIFGFLRMSTVGLTTQAIGAGDKDESALILTRALLIAGAGGVLLIALQGPIFSASFALAPASAEVERLAREYMSIRIYSSPAAISIYALSGWMIARERTRHVLILQFWVNGLNIVLDFIFVLGLGWGVQGVAIATFLAEWSGFGLGLWLCRDWMQKNIWRNWARVFECAKLIRLAGVNTDIMIRSILLQAIFVSFLFLGSDFGDVPLAANQILLQFLYVTAFGLDGFAFAAEIFVGTALGARDRPALRRGALLASTWGGVVVFVLAVSFALFGGAVIDIMTNTQAVQAEARQYLPFMVAAPLIGGPAWMLDGIFIGATQSRDMRNMMAISAAVYAISVMILVPQFANYGLWISFLISFGVRGITLGLRYPSLEARAGETA